jgi:hypothetical protein
MFILQEASYGTFDTLASNRRAYATAGANPNALA